MSDDRMDEAGKWASGEYSHRNQVDYSYPNDQAINLACVAIMDAMEVVKLVALELAERSR